MSAPRPVLFMLTRDTKTRSVPVGSTSESETIAGTCCSRRNAVDPVPVVLALGPGKLHHPAELIAYSVGESLYPVGCRAGLDLKPSLRSMRLSRKANQASVAEPSTSGVTTATNSVTKYFMNSERRGRVTGRMSDSSGSEPISGVPSLIR